MRRKILIGIASLISLVLLVVFSLFLYLQFADLSRYKPQIAQRLTQYLGRSVVIEGNFDLKIIPLSLSLTDAKIANAPWGSRPDMLSVHELDLQLGLPALLSGELLISRFILDDVQVMVEYNEQGETNWKIGQPGKSDKQVTTKSTSVPLEFFPDVEIDITNITLLYSQEPASDQHEFVLDKATIKGLSDLARLQIDVKGQIDRYGYQVSGLIGTLDELLSSDKSFPVDVKVHAVNTDLEVNGTIQNVLKLEKMQFKTRVSTNNLTAWQQWLGMNIDRGPVRINADIDGDLDKISVSKFAVQLGNSTAQGNATLDLGSEKPRINAQLNIKDIAVKEFLDAMQGESVNTSKAEPQVSQQNPFEQALDLSFLTLFDASLQLSVDSVGYEQWIVERFSADIKVEDGNFTAAPFSITSKLGQAKGEFNLASEQGFNIAKLDIDAKELALGKFYDMSSSYQGIGALKGSILAKGKSLSEMYANLQGNATAHYVNKDHQHESKIVLTRSKINNSAAPFEVAIVGELQKVAYKISGEIGGPLALIEDKPYPVTANLNFLNVDANAKGTIANLFYAQGFNIVINARTDDMARLNKTLDTGLPALKKVQVKTVLRGDYSLLKFLDIKAKSRYVNLTGNVAIDFSKQLTDIGGNINIAHFDLAGVQKEIAGSKKSGSGENAKVAKVKKPDLTQPMSFSALQDFTMNIKVKSLQNDSLNIPYYPVTNLSAVVTVTNGVFSVSPLNLESPVGNVRSFLKINSSNKVPAVDFIFQSDELELQQIAPDENEQSIWDAMASTDISLHAQGDSLQDWLESVAGTITLNYRNKQLTQIYELLLTRETKQPATTAAPVSVRINSKISDTMFQGSGSISAPHAWLTQAKPAKFDFKTNVKGFVAEVQGKMDDLLTGQGMDIQISINDQQSLDPFLGQTELINRVGKVQLTSEIKGSYSDVVASHLKGNIGTGRISGSTSVNFREDPPEMDFNLTIDDLDTSQWMENSDQAKTVKENQGKLFSSNTLPFDLLKGVHVNGSIKGSAVQLEHVKAQKFDASINLKNGILVLDIGQLKTDSGSLDGDLHIDANAEPAKVSLKLKVPKLNLEEVTRNTDAQGMVKGNFGADLSVSSEGNSVADLVTHLDGHVRLLVDEGEIDSALFNVYTGGLRAMVGMLTVVNEKTTKINCGICGLNFNSGKGVTEVALLDTKNSTLVAEGWVDFNNDTFSVKASPVSKGLQLNVNLPVVIQGPFSHPSFSTETTSALYRAAEIATVWFVPSTAIFIGYDQLRSSDQNPCVNMVAPTKDGVGMRALKGAGKALQDIGSVFSKSLSTLLGGFSEPASRKKNTSESVE